MSEVETVLAHMEPEITESMLEAQQEADALADELETKETEKDVESVTNSAPVVPKLLQIAQQQGEEGIRALAEKTHNMRSRGQQLDILLLKAESYSHFILQNQQRSAAPKSPPPNDGEGKNEKGSSGKKRKKSDGEQEADAADVGISSQPKSLIGGTLMPYQLDGLRWLISLWENGLSGILADEMGLGKTIQVISLLGFLREQGCTGPFLIAGPLATLPNWMNEFKKWLPSCEVVLYHGSKAERTEIREKRMIRSKQKSMIFPVVVTSFEICIADRKSLERYDWQYVILDEGHRIKNRNCRLVKELKQIPSSSRLLLTGTPIQNTLEELWALLNFVNPRIFDDLEVFQSWFGFKNIGKDTQVEDIIGDEQKSRVISKLHEVLRPFLLRRLKKDVLLKMPPKREIIVYATLTSLQKEYYARVLDSTIRNTLVSMNIPGARDTSQINQLMNLRKVCNHPFLFGEPRDQKTGLPLGDANPALLAMASGKFRLLDRMLTRLQQTGHKVLLFSQMTELLNIVQDYLAHKGMVHHRMDGSTKVSALPHFIPLPAAPYRRRNLNFPRNSAYNLLFPRGFAFLLRSSALSPRCKSGSV
jgi:ATP-dependent DNA helicase